MPSTTYRKTTLTVREETRQRLEALKIISAESFDSVLNRILDRYEETLAAEKRDVEIKFKIGEVRQEPGLEQYPTAQEARKSPK